MGKNRVIAAAPSPLRRPYRLDERLHPEDRARRKPKRSRGRTAVSDKTGTLTIGAAASRQT